MTANPFETVKNYSEMLNKITFFNFVAGLIITYFLGNFIPEIKCLLSSIKWNFDLIGTNFTFMNIAIPFLIAILARIIKLHDKISDIFQIRLKYDVNIILRPIANKISFQSDDLNSFLKLNRIVLMRNCFYKYASTQESKCEIDYHSVIMAIDQFSWYWIIIEILVLTSLAIIVSAIFKAVLVSVVFLVFTILLFILNEYVLKLCKRYTTIEVEQILENQNRINDITLYFHALQNQQSTNQI